MNNKSVLRNILKIVSSRTNLFILLQFFFFHNEILQAQWAQMHGPIGGSSVNMVTTNGNNIFACMSSDLYYTTNEGLNWNLINQGLYCMNIYSLAFRGNNIFAGTDFGIYLSTNYGSNWNPINNGLPNQNNYNYSIVIKDSTIFSAAFTGLYKSTDFGTSWFQVGIPYTTYLSLSVSGENIIAGTKTAGIYLSTDDGENWILIDKDLETATIYSLFSNDSNVYAGTSNGFYVSSNYGTNWVQRNNSLGYSFISLNIMSSLIYAGTFGGGMFVSSDYGVTWKEINNGLTSNKVYAIATLGNNLYTGVINALVNGVYRSTNNGNKWERIGLPTVANQMILIDTNIYAGTYYGVFRSTNRGMDWSELTIPDGENEFRVISMAASDTNIVAGTDSRGLFLSTNNGVTFTQLNNVFKSEGVLAVAAKGSNIFAGTYVGFYYSPNFGAFWNLINSSVINSHITSILFYGNNIYAGGMGIYISTDNGNSWSKLLSSAAVINKLAVCGNYLYASLYGGGIYRSTNDGHNWLPVNKGLTDLYVNDLVVYGENIILGTGKSSLLPGGLFLSSDNGNNWISIYSGLPNNQIQSLLVNDHDLLVGTSAAGVWRRPLSELVGVAKEENNLPQNYVLSQNFPNPFNPNTVISYSLPSASNVKLSVYNTIGQTVKVLENGYKNTGNYSVNFNASDLPSGIYFYKLEAGQFRQVKKMMIMK